MAQDFLGGIGSGLSSLATTVTHDAGEFVAHAQNSVAQLVGSGVNAQGKITGPLAEHFGSDPVQFVMNATKFFDGFMRDVCNRVAVRTSRAAYSVDTPKGKASIPSTPAKGDSSAHVALLLTLGALHHPAILIEEAGLKQQGLPVKRGLDGGERGYVFFPTVGIGGRGFFGIDEAAAAAAVLAILVAIAPAIITALISVVGAIAPQVVSTVSDIFKPPAPLPDPNAGKILGLDPPIALGAGVVVLALLGFAAYKMRGHHGAAA